MDIYDAVDAFEIPEDAVAVWRYLDGRQSQWTAAMVEKWAHVWNGTITTGTNPVADEIDIEAGDASPVAGANWAFGKRARGEWCAIYCGGSNLDAVSRALEARGLAFTDAKHWPAEGIYLDYAHPDGPVGAIPPGLPVTPICVQDRWMGIYDVSTCYAGFPFAPTPPPPVDPPTSAVVSKDDDMTVVSFTATADASGHIDWLEKIPEGCKVLAGGIVDLKSDYAPPVGTWDVAAAVFAGVGDPAEHPGECHVILIGAPGHFYSGRLIFA